MTDSPSRPTVGRLGLSENLKVVPRRDERCMVVNCENRPGGGTRMAVELPQIGADPMTVTGPVCEEHWFGNWHRERRQLKAEIDLLRQRLAAISALASDETRPSPNAARPSVSGTEGDGSDG